MHKLISENAHNIALLILVALGYAAKEQILGPTVSLGIVGLFFVLTVFLS